MMEKLLDLVKQKIGLFLEYEKTCEALMKEEIEGYGEILNQRDEMIEQITALNLAITEVVHVYSKEEQDKLEKILSNQMDHGDVDEKALNLFEISQQLYQIMSRLLLREEEILRIMNDRKEILAEQIKVSNNLPKINRYFQTNQMSQDDSKNIGKI